MIVEARTIKKFAFLPKVVEGRKIWLKQYQVVQELRPNYVEDLFAGGYKRVYEWYNVAEQLL